MSNGRSLVRNAADPDQVKHAARKERQREQRVGEDVRAVMGTLQGRRLMWELLSRAGIYRSVWDNSARIHYNAGRQDFGHELLGLLTEHDDEGYLLMEREARAVARNDGLEAAAVQTRSADGGSNG